MVELKVATLVHIWVDWLRHPEHPVVVWEPGAIQHCPGISRSTHVIILRFATQAQRDHKNIHAGNFGVQPQAIMGSVIVEYIV